MKTLTLTSRFQDNTTSVENEFIDHYMAKANGEYVKVYLLFAPPFESAFYPPFCFYAG